MKLSALLGAPCDPDPDVMDLVVDSRDATPGALFAALPGGTRDGAAFAPLAEAAGAVAVLAAEDAVVDVKTAIVVRDPSPRRRLAEIAARFHPGQPSVVVGVTGTNGKTSVAWFAARIWRALGRKAGSLGTLGARAPGVDIALDHTTPEPVTLHRTLSEMAIAGVERLAMEVSSHGLDQRRADAVSFAGAAFTNITRDHLDYHPTFDAYSQAKLRLFTELVARDGFAAVNADGEGAARIAEAARARGLRTLTTGRAGEDLALVDCAPTADGLDLRIRVAGEELAASTPLIGAFQAENALLAAALVIGTGEDAVAAVRAIEALEGPPGRMQRAARVAGAGVYVDYAHTPDAVATALVAARPHAAGRVFAIIGAGGDRDKDKRPLMGAAAAAGADAVIVTDDNPRNEDAAEIRRMVRAGAPDAIEIADRAEAIAAGVAKLQAGDLLLICGKGHETGQIVGGETILFDDVAVAAAAAQAREAGR